MFAAVWRDDYSLYLRALRRRVSEEVSVEEKDCVGQDY